MISKEAIELWLRVEHLPLSDRLWFQEVLAGSVRRTIDGKRRADDLAAMAANPDIQRECRLIEEDFRALNAPPAPEGAS
jgi:hypothetical protein